MANMFRCVIAAGSGDGADLIVTCSQNFAGKVITCTDGGDHTYTETCPSSSPYTVTFKSIPVGTYTISGVISGQTFSTTKTIDNFTASLNDIPDGATVIPTDDVQTLLHCANIWDKSYSTVSALLADTTSLLAVISDNNAVDYLVRSTTFASSVCANSTAMSDINANNYCANSMLADSTWRTAICNSTYFETVLTTKVPTMTSNNTPSGTCGASTSGTDTAPWYPFSGQGENYYWNAATGQSTGLLWYEFTTSKRIIEAVLTFSADGNGQGKSYNFKVQAYDENNSSWVDVSDSETVISPAKSSPATIKLTLTSSTKYKKYGIHVSGSYPMYQSGQYRNVIRSLQFYGRN